MLEDINLEKDLSGRDPLVLAFYYNHLEIVRLLIKPTKYMDKYDPKWSIMACLEHSSFELCNCLIDMMIYQREIAWIGITF